MPRDFIYKVELSNGVVETATTNKGAFYAGALAASQYNKRHPDKDDVKVARFLPTEDGNDGHSLRIVERAD